MWNYEKPFEANMLTFVDRLVVSRKIRFSWRILVVLDITNAWVQAESNLEL